MATVTTTSCLEQIGETAGHVWHVLDQHGPMSLARLVKEADAQRDIVTLAVGWLAREDKVEIEETKRGRIVSLIAE